MQAVRIIKHQADIKTAQTAKPQAEYEFMITCTLDEKG
jgi:hypothetical protein